MKEKPSYYSILPAPVRYSTEISDFEKILFSEISALINHKGYCNASNKYFADLYDKRSEHISKNITNLEKSGFIHRVPIMQGTQVIERRIYLSDQMTVLQKIWGTAKFAVVGTADFAAGGTAKKVKENNTISIHSNSTPHFTNAESAGKKRVTAKREKATGDFDLFWNAYGYKKDKNAASKAWGKLTAEEQAEALRCAPIYASETVTADADKSHWKPRRKFPATWLNGRGWEDYQEQAQAAAQEQATVTPYDGDYSKYLDWVRDNCPVITAAVKYLSKPQYIQYREMGERVRLSGPVMYRLLTKSHREFEEGRTTHPTAYDHFIQAIADHRRKTQEI